MSKATALTPDTFQENVSSGVSLIDFWAEWCGPCRMMTPILDDLAEEFEGRATIYKVNVDEAQDLAGDYGVSSIPMLMVMKDGEEAKRFVGVTQKTELAKALEDALG